MLFLILHYNKLSIFASNLKMLPWALENCDGYFYLKFYRPNNESIIKESNWKIDL